MSGQASLRKCRLGQDSKGMGSGEAKEGVWGGNGALGRRHSTYKCSESGKSSMCELWIINGGAWQEMGQGSMRIWGFIC